MASRGGRGAKLRLVGGCRGARGAWTADRPDRCRFGVCEIIGCPLPVSPSAVDQLPLRSASDNVSLCSLPFSPALSMTLGSPPERFPSLHCTDEAHRGPA